MENTIEKSKNTGARFIFMFVIKTLLTEEKA